MVTGRRMEGVTLIELLIALAIIALLAGIAYPAYIDSVRKSHRKEAAGEVLDIAAGVERVKAQRFSYTSVDGSTRDLDRYSIRVFADASTYRIKATPIAGQVGDRCGALYYDQSHVWRFVDSTVPATDPSSDAVIAGMDETLCLN